MKKNKIIIIVIVLLLLAGAGCGTYFYLNNNKTKEETKEEVVRLEDDFYEYVNGAAIKKATIPNDSSIWGTFYDAQERVDDKKEKLVEEILADSNYKNDNLVNAVELYTDYEGRNRRGLTELKPYFDMIDNAKTIEELNKAFLVIESDLGVPILFAHEDFDDFYDASKHVLAFQPIQIEANLEVYTEEKNKNVKEKLEEFRKKVLKQYGYDDNKINDVNAKFNDLITTVQSKSLVLAKITDPLELLKNKLTYNEIKNKYKNLPLTAFLDRYKINKLGYYYIVDLGHFDALEAYYTNEHLDTFKELGKYKILSNFVLTFTTDDYFNILIETNNGLSGQKRTAEDVKEETIKDIKAEAIGDDLYIKYEEKYFTKEDKEKINNLIEEIKSYYRETIKNCTWMTDATKATALKKLDTLKSHIGFTKGEDSDEFIYKSKKDGGTLISNVIAENRHDSSKWHEVFEEAGDGTVEFDDLTVNAYYNPLDNSINFPAAFKEIYGDTTDEFEILGTAGAVIGHEISHAFDNNGSKFDQYGKVRNWWTEEDKASYDKLTEKIKSYYSQYEYGGFKVDGEKTVGENIADLGAVNCIVSIADKKGATTDNFKKLFESYTKLWLSKETKEYIESTHLSDTHSPAKIRVNAVLSSIDKFYEVYGIKENDKMFVKEEDRVGLW